ncbi:hypothetical protein CRG98_019862 [Punica granatum]|uniref:Uncharacterized protein n=1 Tax=Punica granatum TaxID=22663 RepID=A0A2I0JTX3_PUNGR|nr:hypothetical protein CRG98_019862 [Punica granatum]
MLCLASGCEERVGEGFEDREKHVAGRVLSCTSTAGGQARGEELDRTVRPASRCGRACAGASDERTWQVDVQECRHACMNAEGRPGRTSSGARALAGVDEHAGVRMCGDAERLVLELVTGVLFTREHDLRPER